MGDKAKRSGTERVVIRPREEEEEKEEEGKETRKTGCHLHLLSMEEEASTLFKYLCRIHQDETKRLCSKGPKIARGREPIWDHRTK